MHKWQILTSIFVLFFVCDEVTADDKEDVLATWNAVKAAWVIGDIDATQKHDAEHSAAHLSERARIEADPVTRRRSVEARRPLHRPLCQDLPLNKRRSSE